jgi:CDP-glycerol glycerophosphotransferase (TagB/SpsB family)
VTELTLPEAVPLAHALVDRIARDREVRVLFIKGPTAQAQGLREPRVSLDVDALVDPARRHLLAERLTEMGWVDEHPYTSPTVLPMHSLTHRHRAWPCELDLHDRFPGFFLDPQAVFERMWAGRDSVTVAAREIPCPEPAGQALVLALHALRDPHDQSKAAELAQLAERVTEEATATSLRGLAELARDLGAADTAAPFLDQVGAPPLGRGSTRADDLRAWQLRTQPADVTGVSWVHELRRLPWHRWPGYLWYAATLSDVELRLADPGLPPGRIPLLRARVRRLRRGLAALPDAVRSVSTIEPTPAPAVVVRTTWQSRRLPAPVLALASAGLGALDRVIPKRGVVLRTFPDFDDQGLETASALSRAGVGPLTWLVKDGAPEASTRTLLPPGLRVVDAGSLRGVLAYLRARVVVHTHGVYGIPPRAARKTFVNLWHGMPVKRLEEEPAVSARQTDVLTVTSGIHGRHIAETWNLDPSHLVETGLPRNDRMLRASRETSPDALARLARGRPVVLWLPTYRRSVLGEIRLDGEDFANPFEFPGADLESVGSLAESLGVHVVVKPHPMAPAPAVTETGSVSVWDQARLTELGLTLYELLAHADVLVTDHSSVWVDFLLLDRPMVFALADLTSYADSRGHYFTPLADHLPGPVVTDLAELGPALAEALEHDAWAARRRDLSAVHHTHLDAGSAARVAGLVQARMGGRRSDEGS